LVVVVVVVVVVVTPLMVVMASTRTPRTCRKVVGLVMLVTLEGGARDEVV